MASIRIGLPSRWVTPLCTSMTRARVQPEGSVLSGRGLPSSVTRIGVAAWISSVPSGRRPHHPPLSPIFPASAAVSWTKACRESTAASGAAASPGPDSRSLATASPSHACLRSCFWATSAKREAARSGSIPSTTVASVNFVFGSWGTNRCARSSQRSAVAVSSAVSAATPRSMAARASSTTADSGPRSAAGMDQAPAAPEAFSYKDDPPGSGAGGSAARSALASCIPCAIARSVQRLASSIFCSPPSPRAR